jgi:hypothetical protein
MSSGSSLVPTLAAEYYDRSLPVARRKLCQAGIRVVRVLYECFEWMSRQTMRSTIAEVGGAR